MSLETLQAPTEHRLPVPLAKCAAQELQLRRPSGQQCSSQQRHAHGDLGHGVRQNALTETFAASRGERGTGESCFASLWGLATLRIHTLGVLTVAAASTQQRKSGELLKHSSAVGAVSSEIGRPETGVTMAPQSTALGSKWAQGKTRPKARRPFFWQEAHP